MEFIKENLTTICILIATISISLSIYKGKFSMKNIKAEADAMSSKTNSDLVKTVTTTKTTANGEETTVTTYTSNEVIKPAKGVHIGWWIMWFIICFPALIIVAVIHFNKLRK